MKSPTGPSKEIATDVVRFSFPRIPKWRKRAACPRAKHIAAKLATEKRARNLSMLFDIGYSIYSSPTSILSHPPAFPLRESADLRHGANRVVKIQAVDAAGIVGTPAVRRSSETSFREERRRRPWREPIVVRDLLLFPACFYVFGRGLLSVQRYAGRMPDAINS